jgi:protein kinase-like protein
MGVVYRARDLRLGRMVALKLLSGETAQDERFRERFLRESRAAASIDHPNVLPVYEAADADGELFIAMRLVDGEDLATLLSREGPLDPVRAAGLLAQAADALDAIHLHGLVHRDVKPSNVLIHTAGAREHVYVADFGIAKASAEGTPLTDTGAFMGTIDYCAPEVIRGDVLDARADVYSLGCVLFECLTGETPFTRDSSLAVIYAHLEDPPPSVRDRRPQLAAALDAVVARALAKQVGDRFQSAGELAGAALAAVGTTPGSAAGVPAASRRPRVPALRLGRGKWRLALAGALLVLVAAGVTVAVLSGDDGSGGSQPGGSVAQSAGEPGDRTPASEGRSVVGSDLAQPPGDSGYCSGGGQGSACTVLQLKLGTSDQAVRADGVITRWSVRGGKGELALRVIDGPPARRRVIATGPTVQATPSGVETFSVRIPVYRGQRVGVEQGKTGFLPFRYRDETSTAEFYEPPLGASPAAPIMDASGATGYEYLYNATIEPDDDRDGRGDLTQDPDHGGAGAHCPSSGVLARGSGSSVIRSGDQLFGCRGGVRTLVGRSSGSVRFRLFRFGGHQLALVRVANGRSSILFFDLADRRRTFSTSLTYADDRPADWTVTDLVVGSTGNAAWMATPHDAGDRTTVWTRSRGKVQSIDSGRLRPGSLRLGADDVKVAYTDLEGRTRESGF